MIARGAAASSIISTIGLFAAVAFRLLPSSARILTSLQSARFAHAAIDRVHGDITSLESSAIGTTSERLAFGSTLELRAISYRYEGADRWALHHVDCAIQRGELVGISGPSGSGKTTLIDIMFGLLSPSEGVVLVDGRDLSTRLRAWQNQLGYVSQFVFLSNDSVRRNVAFGVLESEIQDDDVWRALAQAGVDTLFRDLPAGLATVLGEAGTRLSGGERQRIGIARALYHDPAIVLLDEATSALDVATERAIIETVDRLRGRKTVVIVSHRATALQNCDRVLTLENGSLAQAVSVC
jgi:ABC-type bacteriocin/lantibiotic exporters, contain an N-terminal double-glycine peptidase domain